MYANVAKQVNKDFPVYITELFVPEDLLWRIITTTITTTNNINDNNLSTGYPAETGSQLKTVLNANKLNVSETAEMK